MNTVLFERFTKLSLVRATFWFAMGIILLLNPEFLLGGLFYMLIAYLLVNAVLRIVMFVRETTTGQKQNNKAENICRYASLVIAVLFLIAAAHLIFYREWLNEFTSVFLGGLLMIKAVLYFVISLCAAKALQKALLVVLSGVAFLGAAAVIVFTFGFGISGVTGMTIVLGIALLLAFVYEVAAFGICRRNR